MKKIGVFLASGTMGGGMFQYNLTILDALRSSSFEVICVYVNSDWREYLEKFYPSFVAVDLSKYSGFETVWDNLVRLVLGFLPLDWKRRWMKYLDTRVVKMWRVGAGMWIFPSQDQMSFESGLPALTSIHDLMHRYEKEFSEVSGKEFDRREYLYSNICQYSKGILVDSLIGKQQLLDSYPEAKSERIHVLPYIAPEYIFHKNIGVGRRLNLPKKFIFYPAQFWSHKNHINLIKAFELSLSVCPDLNLVLCGRKNNNYSKVLELINKLNLKNKVKILGYVEDNDLAELYRRSVALIMPTFFGPTNIPPLEAMAVGCPVAVSDIYGAREQLGNAALYFNPKSIRGITRSIEILYGDKKVRDLLVKRGFLKTKEWGRKQFSGKLKSIISMAGETNIFSNC